MKTTSAHPISSRIAFRPLYDSVPLKADIQDQCFSPPAQVMNKLVHGRRQFKRRILALLLAWGSPWLGVQAQITHMPTHVQLDVPYMSQLDGEVNFRERSGITSIAGVLAFYGIQPPSETINLSDYMYKTMESYGDLHDPYALKRLIEGRFKLKDDFRMNATWGDIIEALRGGTPVVTVGYFSPFGRYITIIGYTDTHVIVHDPSGNAISSYAEKNGQAVLYPIQYVIQNLSPESVENPSNIWAHFIKP